MDPYVQIWESSRINAYSRGYPTVIWSGIGILIVLCVIRNNVRRRIAKIVAIIAFALVATERSSREIAETWRIRREWAEIHASEMTADGNLALTVDGANLTLPHNYPAVVRYVELCNGYQYAGGMLEEARRRWVTEGGQFNLPATN